MPTIDTGSMTLMNAVVETFVFGIYTLLTTMSIYLTFRTGLRPAPKIMMLSACIVMYATAATHWALVLRQINRIEGVVAEGIEAAEAASSLTFLLLINIVLSDIIVLWRAWVVWSRNRVVKTISVVLITSTLVILCVSGIENACTFDSPAGFELRDPFGTTAFILSWITNIWATTLVSYKAWRHRRLIRRDLFGKNMRTQAEKVLILFVDTGLIYCMLWTVLVAYTIVAGYANGGSAPWQTTQIVQRFVSGVENVKQSYLIDIIGIYPTAIILLVALTKSYCERTLRDIETPQIASNSPTLPKGGDTNNRMSLHTLPEGIVSSVHLMSEESPVTGVFEQDGYGNLRSPAADCNYEQVPLSVVHDGT